MSVASFLYRWFPWVFLAVCTVFFARVALLNWDGPILDGSAFRQSQTAISAEYLVKGGPILAYETPVLGAPWSLPFEFPVYQLCVVAVVKSTGLPLDPAGRLVSISSALVGFALIFVFVRRGTGSPAAGLFAAGLGMITPLYAFYARTFMIESTALCLALGLIVAAQGFLTRPRSWLLLVIFAVGLLAGLTKATTYAVALAVIAVLAIGGARAWWLQIRTTRHPLLLCAATFAAFAVPFFIALAWVHYTDALKGRNELAQFLTSTALREWNWGTWAQRMTLKTWDDILSVINLRLLGGKWAWLLLGAILVWLCIAVQRKATRGVSGIFVLACFTGFIAGPLAFTNLYWRHDYYFFASGIYLPALVGGALGALWESRHWLTRVLAGLVALPLFAVPLMLGYQTAYYPMQMNPHRGLVELGAKVAELTPTDAVVLIEGRDWDSSLPYYSHRRALMNRSMLAPSDPVLAAALERLGKPLGAMVVGPLLKGDRYYISRQIRGLGVPMERVHASADGDVYLPPLADGKLRLEDAWRNSGFEVMPWFAASQSIEQTNLAGRSAMLVHAPGLLLLKRDATQRTLHVGYGLREDAYSNGNVSEGAIFIIEFEPITGPPRIRLMDVVLDPSHRPADRGPKAAIIALPPGQSGSIFLQTESGPSEAFDWTVWRDVTLQ